MGVMLGGIDDLKPVYATWFEALACAMDGRYVERGCEVEKVSGMTLRVKSGVVWCRGVRRMIPDVDITVAQQSDRDRVDVIVYDGNTQMVNVLRGSRWHLKDNVYYPVSERVRDWQVPLALVYVRKGATEIDPNDIWDVRVVRDGSSEVVHLNRSGLISPFKIDVFLSGWQYRRPITISNSAGTDLKEYRACLVIDTASLVSAGKMRSDCGDLRFTDANGNMLPYWIQSGENTSSTRVWVKLPVLPAGGRTIYMHYGNPNASGLSDMWSVFSGNIRDGCVGLWEFYEGKGNVLNDSSGYGNHGTIYNAVWTKVDDFYALDFNGTNAYVQIPSSPVLNPTTQITVSGWFYWKGRTGLIQNGVRKQNQYLLFWWNDTDGFVHTFSIYSNGAWRNINLGLTPENEIKDKWTHWVGVYDGSQLRLYINGVLRGSRNWTGTINTTTNALQFGREPAGYYYKGSMGLVSIYNRALTHEEVWSLFINSKFVLSGIVPVGSFPITRQDTATIGSEETVVATFLNTALYVKSDSSIGVGVSNPLDRLHVRGNVRIEGVIRNAQGQTVLEFG